MIEEVPTWNMVHHICPSVPLMPCWLSVLLLFGYAAFPSHADIRRVPPRFFIPPSNKEVKPGGSAVLSCVATGAPVPYVKWMTGEIELKNEEEMPVGRNILHLTNIRESANYTCVAMSFLGTIKATAQVTVKALPKPPTSLTVTETMATSVTLTWDSENPEPVFYYVIQYRSKASDSSYREVDRVTTTRYSISGLSPYSVYEFRVMAVNNIGRGPPSDAVETRTSEQAPSSPPLHVQARMLSSSTMLVQWEPPEEPNGQIRGYRIYYTTDPDAQLIAWLKHNTDNNRLTTISGLTANVTYSLCVLGFTSVGDGPPSDVLQVKTLPGVPAQPSGFKAEAEPDTRIKLKWLWPVQEPITWYELHYWEAGTDNKIRVTFIPAGSYVVEGLKPDTLYKFSLAARSEMGLGVFTKPIEARTAQYTPSAPPQDVQVLSLSSTSIRVSWMPPPAASRNGAIVRYTVSYQAVTGEDTERHEVTDIGADATSVVLEGLGKWTEYVVHVRAHTDVGPGPESAPVHIRTKEDVPGAPPRALEVEAINSTAIRVTWKPPLPGKQHGQIRGYQVLYFRLENGEPRGHPNIMDVVLPEAQEAIISGLNSETSYSVTVAAYTIRGDGVRSKAKVIKTKAAVPGKPTMLISSTVGNAALIQWQPPKDMPGELIGYRLRYKRVDEESFTVRNFSSTDEHYMATGLFKGATYSFHLSTKNRAGTGEEFVKNISTEEEVPSGFPLNLSVEGMTTTTIRLTWLPPAPAERNGQITHYVVVYRDINSQQNNTNRTSDTHVMLHDLRPDTTYDIRIQAFTSKGGGPMSPSIQSRTMATSPAFATSFGVRAVMKTSVLLTWELPENFKSQGLFKILYNQRSVEVQGNMKRKLITGLKPDSNYSFVLTSRGNSAGGLQQLVSIRTAPDLLKTKPVLFKTDKNSGRKVTINLPKVVTTAPISWYYIVVVPGSLTSSGRCENLDEMELDELLEVGKVPPPRHRHRRSYTEIPRPYVAAKLEYLPETFLLGDEQNYNGFYNRPVPSNQPYQCFIMAEMKEQHLPNGNKKQRVFSSSPYSDPVMVENGSMAGSVDSPKMLWVMGPVLAAVLAVVLAVSITLILYKRKRASPLPKDEHLSGVKDSLKANSSDRVEMKRLNCQTPDMREHPPISVCELADHIECLKANDNLLFSQEYESIDPGQKFTCENSNMEVNKLKNRYANVIAYDHSRVVLTSVDAVPGSNYINANYIDGYRKQNTYIATQDPLPETFNDFWRMVWEQRTSTIIMLTRLEEKSQVKCDQYWPVRGTETYGMIQVTVLDSVELATYSMRTFVLEKNGLIVKREVRHFQFMAWPDHGVPEYPASILAFLRRVKACNPSDAGPMVVHCSAGVGRTGCLIVIDAMLERVKHEKTVDIYGHVTCMRSQRNYMVQTEDQYIFIHEALLEAANCGVTEVPARNLQTHIQRLSQPPPGETVSAMELEFKRLANSKAHASCFISANLPCNKFKNRLVNIMPFESTRVCLQPIRGVEGSDYINASYINSYRQQNAYIATQGPLPETTEDFWRMLWEHNSTIVVMLTDLCEIGWEHCDQYWPAYRSTRHQYFVVDTVAEYIMPYYILREFLVTDIRDSQSRMIRQFQFTDWSEQGLPKTSEGFIVFIGQVHKTKEKFGQDGPITVHCSSGVGRTGVFITLSIVLERMRYERVLDLFQTVKTLRTQRPAMVQTEDQYQLCYQAALEYYLGSFDHYAA
ncbi:receptor-type tyrosine-protein phosphatase F-like isoform X2 [Pangasianodon hypophthalmus]|uniref:receptor-type tyrosine-protein phosphatase F-like isoform X2 n=1 Tax=Pangasianodon hypophthalmus TaxID=310915 RepID=UPI002307822F|nr:receptor-type tyrosine-protein phosphatase F-like isoform X2 [Pangasianodon hypophthalmus]